MNYECEPKLVYILVVSTCLSQCAFTTGNVADAAPMSTSSPTLNAGAVVISAANSVWDTVNHWYNRKETRVARSVVVDQPKQLDGDDTGLPSEMPLHSHPHLELSTFYFHFEA